MQNYPDYKNRNKIVDVAFIIVNFNTKKLLEDLLSFFETSDLPFSYSIIVVDNASTDGSVEFLNNKKNIIFIQNINNIGYGRAVNKGLMVANGKYICVLNTDLILNKDTLINLWNYMEENLNVGVCSPIITYPTGRIQGFFFKFSTLLLYSDFIKKIYSKLKKISIAISKFPVKVDGISGAFIFLRASIIANEILFDEEFFFYFEDTDLAHKLKDRNVITMVLPSSKIIHLGGQSSNGKNWKLFYQSKYLYIKKHYGIAHAKNIYIMDFFKAKIKSFIYRILTLFYPTNRVRTKFNFYSELSRNFSELKIRFD